MACVSLRDTTWPVLALIQAILGKGLPVALQKSVALPPSVTGLEHRWMVTLGSSKREKVRR